jgi:hypothetical protein
MNIAKNFPELRAIALHFLSLLSRVCILSRKENSIKNKSENYLHCRVYYLGRKSSNAAYKNSLSQQVNLQGVLIFATFHS